MGIIKGGALRGVQLILYFITFCCAAIVLGIYSYFLSVQADRSYGIPTWQKAVEGLSGAATLYSLVAVLLTCCLAGIAFFSIVAFIMDILFAAAFIAIAIMTRDGASCSGNFYTPLGYGNANDQNSGYNTGTADGDQNYTYQVKPYTACRLNTAAFAVSIIAILFFIVTAFMQLGLIRSHGKEKRYGPGPSNNYTSGYGKRRFWQRRNKHANKDAELGMTGTAPVATTTEPAVAHNTHHTHNAHSGYHTQPQGTGVNPYGYDNTAPANHNYTTGTATNY